MTDGELVAALQDGTLPASRFSHLEHVRAAWWYLRCHPLPEALARFSSTLQRFAVSNGAAGKYHETITIAYMLIIAERLDGARELSWREFAARNPDLLVSSPSVLSRYYEDETLASERARRSFVMPDRVPLRPGA